MFNFIIEGSARGARLLPFPYLSAPSRPPMGVPSLSGSPQHCCGYGNGSLWFFAQYF